MLTVRGSDCFGGSSERVLAMARIHNSLVSQRFHLEELEPRVLLSGAALAAAAAGSAAPDFQILVHEEQGAQTASLQQTLAYDPASHLQDMFSADSASNHSPASSETADKTVAETAVESAVSSDSTATPKATANSASLDKADSVTPFNLSASSSASGRGQYSSEVASGTASTISTPQTEQLTETLRAANSPPAADIDDQLVVAFSSQFVLPQVAGVAPFFSVFLSSNSVSFTGSDARDALYLRVTNGQLEFSAANADASFSIDLNPDLPGIQSLALSAATRITVNLEGGDDALEIDTSLNTALETWGGSLNFDGGEGSDSLVGPGSDCGWWVTGANAGTLNRQVNFQDVETFSGAAANKDTFTVELGGVFAGVMDGGVGGFDTLVVRGANNGSYTPGQVFGDGVLNSGSSRITFTGLEPVIVDGTGVAGGTFTFTTPSSGGGNDVLTIDSPAPGQNRISGTSGGVPFESVTFSNFAQVVVNSGANDRTGSDLDLIHFASPLVANDLKSLTIQTGPGDDRLDIEGLGLTNSVAITLTLGAGTNSVTGPSGGGAWTFAAENTGSFRSSASPSDGTGDVFFTGLANLTTGTDSDNTFRFADSARLTGELTGNIEDADSIEVEVQLTAFARSLVFAPVAFTSLRDHLG